MGTPCHGCPRAISSASLSPSRFSGPVAVAAQWACRCRGSAAGWWLRVDRGTCARVRLGDFGRGQFGPPRRTRLRRGPCRPQPGVAHSPLYPGDPPMPERGKVIPRSPGQLAGAVGTCLVRWWRSIQTEPTTCRSAVVVVDGNAPGAGVVRQPRRVALRQAREERSLPLGSARGQLLGIGGASVGCGGYGRRIPPLTTFVPGARCTPMAQC